MEVFMFYIICPDGSSLFELPYPKDFCIHCLLLLADQTDVIAYRLLSCSDFMSSAAPMSRSDPKALALLPFFFRAF